MSAVWLWAAYGVGSCFGTLSYTQMARGFPHALGGLWCLQTLAYAWPVAGWRRELAEPVAT